MAGLTIGKAAEAAGVGVDAGQRARAFDDPTGMAVAGDEIFIADFRNNRVQIWRPAQ